MARVPYVTHHDPVNEQKYPLVYGDDALNIWKAIDNNRPVKEGFLAFLASVSEETGLEARQREITILAVAATLRSAYEWHQHVRISLDDDLLRPEEIRAIANGDPTALRSDEAALVVYARAVVHGSVSGAAHDEISRHFDDGTVVGIAMLAGAYVAAGLVMDALGVELEGGTAFVGWDV